MYKIVLLVLSLVTSLFLLNSCSDGGSGLPKINTHLPNSFGDVSDLNIIADTSIWNGQVGDSLRAYFERYYPILPQSEPLFHLRYYSPNDLNLKPIRRELNNFVILVDHSKPKSRTTELAMKDLRDHVTDSMRLIKGRNKWARDQLIFYVNGNGEEQLMSQLKKYKEVIAKAVLEHELPILKHDVYGAGHNAIHEKVLRDSFGINMKIPSYYREATNEKGFLWLRGDTPKINRNILVTKVPYKNQEQLTKASIKKLRDSLGYQFVSTTIVGSYMRINDIDLPLIVENQKIDDQFALCAMGIWEIENDFLGGPFTSYLILTPDKRDLIFVDVFVHAPEKKKRNLMKEMKYIVQSMEFVEK